MSKWNVGRHATLRGRGINEPETEYTWCAFHDDDIVEEIHRHFPTHAEALAYADRMARTREYVLPRVAPQGEVSVSATWYCDQGAIHYINSAWQVVQGTPAELRPLALALLALAEQEEHE